MKLDATEQNIDLNYYYIDGYYVFRANVIHLPYNTTLGQVSQCMHVFSIIYANKVSHSATYLGVDLDDVRMGQD